MNIKTNKLLSFLLAIVMLASMLLVSCADGKNDPSESNDTSFNSETETEKQTETEAEKPTETKTETETETEKPTETETEKPTETETEPQPTPIVNNFEVYQSNTVCGTGHNYAIGSYNTTKVTKTTFRGIFKVQESGQFDYKFYFSNNIDSTWGDGSISHRNMQTKPYKIISAKVGTTTRMNDPNGAKNFVFVTFDGNKSKDVKARETFWSDSVKFNVPKGNFLVFEWTIEYTFMPATNHGGTYFTALYDDAKGKFIPDWYTPMPDLIGCNRNNKLRVAFWGDSITIGEGAPAYKSWAAQVTDKLGPNVSTWNLGLGYARCCDAVNSPAWVEKAKQNDIVIICFGVNDLNSGDYKFGLRNDTQIINDIAKIAKECKDAGCEVIIFTTPPYTYSNNQKIKYWSSLTEKEKELAQNEGYKFFDFASCLKSKDDPTKPAYGGHPNAKGCNVVAQEFIKQNIIEVPKDKLK